VTPLTAPPTRPGKPEQVTTSNSFMAFIAGDVVFSIIWALMSGPSVAAALDF
jgi:hypothetical protein